MTYFLTFLTLTYFLTFLTLWPECHGFSVRNVRFSDKSDCAYEEKSNFLSLSFPTGACLLRARAIRFVRKPDISDKRPTTFQALSCQKRQKHCQKRQKCQICQKTDHCRNSSSKAPAWPGVHSDHSVVDRAVIHGWQIPSTGPACALAGRVLVRPDRRNVRGLGGLLPRRGDG